MGLFLRALPVQLAKGAVKVVLVMPTLEVGAPVQAPAWVVRELEQKLVQVWWLARRVHQLPRKKTVDL